MIDEQLKGRDITDEKVLSSMAKVKRHLFVPAESRAWAHEDRPLPIGYGQTISQPYIVAYMTQAAQLKEGDKVLEVGTGSGYQAAILAEIVKEVYTIEILPELAQTAKARLKQLSYSNIQVIVGDGYKGWPQAAPYDAIIVTAAPTQIPQELIRQLKEGGRMIIPIGSFEQELLRITKTKDGFKEERLLSVHFVPMIKDLK